MRKDFVFGYGSLLNPKSLRATLPDIDVRSCIPARARGFVRTWSVAFPNDGSQPDKSYRDAAGGRPRVVLFVNLEQVTAGTAADAGATGVLIPTTADSIEKLSNRERRYQLADLTSRVKVYPGFEDQVRGDIHVAAFVGTAEFTRPEEVERGVIQREYQEIVKAGFRYWDQQVEVFRRDSEISTVRGPQVPVINLVRRDHALQTPG